MEESAITPIEQQQIEFYDDRIIAVRLADDRVYVPLRPIANSLGLAWASQLQRIKRDTILSEQLTVVFVTNTTDGATAVQTNSMQALPLELINGWLFGISESRVREDVRERVLQYKRDCYRVLYEAFQLNKVTAHDDALLSELLASDSPTAVAYRQAMAIANIARQQLVIESRLESAETRLDDFGNRLIHIETQFGASDRFVTPAQASRISQAVKAIALELGKRSRRNEFGGVYGELYRRFDITAYRELPSSQYDDAMTFLRDWYQSITDNANVPF